MVDREKAAVDVADDGPAARPQHRSLLEQVSRCAYLLDIQGKGYSSRLKLLLHRCQPTASHTQDSPPFAASRTLSHLSAPVSTCPTTCLAVYSGRCVFIVHRPWKEYYMRELKPMTHYVPVREDLADLISQLDWADEHPDEAAAIGRRGQAFAQERLTKAAALADLAKAICEAPLWAPQADEDAAVAGS